MNNNLQIFQNKQFGSIRTIEKDGKVLFCGSDVAKALGYAIPSKAVNTHCKSEGVSKMEVPTNGGIQEMLLLPRATSIALSHIVSRQRQSSLSSGYSMRCSPTSVSTVYT